MMMRMMRKGKKRRSWRMEERKRTKELWNCCSKMMMKKAVEVFFEVVQSRAEKAICLLPLRFPASEHRLAAVIEGRRCCPLLLLHFQKISNFLLLEEGKKRFFPLCFGVVVDDASLGVLPVLLPPLLQKNLHHHFHFHFLLHHCPHLHHCCCSWIKEHSN